MDLDAFKTYTEYPFSPVPSLASYLAVRASALPQLLCTNATVVLLQVLPGLNDELLHNRSVQLEPISTSGVCARVRVCVCVCVCVCVRCECCPFCMSACAFYEYASR